MSPIDSLKTKQTLTVKGKHYHYYSLKAAEQAGLHHLHRLPITLKILLENFLRFETDFNKLQQFVTSALTGHPRGEIFFKPARVLLQDFTGIPALVDLAAMRDALATLNHDPALINPSVPVALITDHSIIAEDYGNPDAFHHNVALEYQRNHERYALMHWGQKVFKNLQIVPPGTGICHQINLEHLAQVVWGETAPSGEKFLYPDTLVGADSHTTMINGLSVLGWGVGGIEAEAVMLGQPISMIAPEVIGVKLSGQLPIGVTATDLVLTITHMLRSHGVVGKFIEFFGNSLTELSVEDRATISNMCPEYGATIAFFPTDQKTLDYLKFTGRDPQQVAVVEAYTKAQGLWSDGTELDRVYSQLLALDLATIVPTMAGPHRPQDKVLLPEVPQSCEKAILSYKQNFLQRYPVPHSSYSLGHGDIVIAAITSCTNTSNPEVMIGAGLLARKARAQGLTTKPWVKTSLAPGSRVVMDYYEKSGLKSDLEALGFYLVGFGCTTCIGNSGALREEIAQTIATNDLVVGAVLSGNRNFDGRIHPQVKVSYLASPPLVVAYALTGTLHIDLTQEPLGVNQEGKPIYLKDIWPSNEEITAMIQNCITPAMFHQEYATVSKGDQHWQELETNSDEVYAWNPHSTYVKLPPYFENFSPTPLSIEDIKGARILALLGDSITTDHISPAGSFSPTSPAGKYLQDHAIAPKDFNAYGARRGNHEVMMRATFANILLENEINPEKRGGYTKYWPTQETMTIYEAAMQYRQAGIPLVVIAGKEYGCGSSRDWAAKGPKLLGVKAVIAESFERIHRSNLIEMGVLPVEFSGERKALKLQGNEIISLKGIANKIAPRLLIELEIIYGDGSSTTIECRCRIDTEEEARYYLHGGILPYVMRKMLSPPPR